MNRDQKAESDAMNLLTALDPEAAMDARHWPGLGERLMSRSLDTLSGISSPERSARGEPEGDASQVAVMAEGTTRLSNAAAFFSKGNRRWTFSDAQ
jgi:hypothetical protein